MLFFIAAALVFETELLHRAQVSLQLSILLPPLLEW